MQTDFLPMETVALDETHLDAQPRPQSNFKKIALAPHDFAGNLYLI